MSRRAEESKAAGLLEFGTTNGLSSCGDIVAFTRRIREKYDVASVDDTIDKLNPSEFFVASRPVFDLIFTTNVVVNRLMKR